MLWEASKLVMFLFDIFQKTSIKSSVSGSSDAVGSSSSNTFGSLIIDLARLTYFLTRGKFSSNFIYKFIKPNFSSGNQF